jgi:hypothetical protein
MVPVARAQGPHLYIGFADSGAVPATVRDVSLQLANYYFKKTWSRNQWTKSREKFVCKWEEQTNDGQGSLKQTAHQSPPLHLRSIETALRHGDFSAVKALGLPEPRCAWLDTSFAFSPDFHAPANNARHALTFVAITTLGDRCPLQPAIDREGLVTTSFQETLLRRIAAERRRMIAASTSPDSPEWFSGFRWLVCDAVSLIENTLHLLYLHAQWAPQPGWNAFNQAALGKRHDVRLMDKLGWVYKITGKPLHANEARQALDSLRVLRNHLQHFDPPAFACTWEEVARWLNEVLLVAELARQIRRCAGSPMSGPLIELLLQPLAVFRPRDARKRRVPPGPGLGYPSSSETALNSGKVPVRPDAVVLRMGAMMRIV